MGRPFVPVDTKTGLLKLLILLVKHLSWCIRKAKNYTPGAPHQISHRSITVDLQVVYCLQIRGVDLMVDHLKVKYTFKKRNVLYFSKRVPKDIRSHYTRGRIKMDTYRQL